MSSYVRRRSELSVVIADAVAAACRQYITCKQQITLEGLIGVTVDSEQVTLISIKDSLRCWISDEEQPVDLTVPRSKTEANDNNILKQLVNDPNDMGKNPELAFHNSFDDKVCQQAAAESVMQNTGAGVKQLCPKQRQAPTKHARPHFMHEIAENILTADTLTRTGCNNSSGRALSEYGENTADQSSSTETTTVVEQSSNESLNLFHNSSSSDQMSGEPVDENGNKAKMTKKFVYNNISDCQVSDDINSTSVIKSKCIENETSVTNASRLNTLPVDIKSGISDPTLLYTEHSRSSSPLQTTSNQLPELASSFNDSETQGQHQSTPKMIMEYSTSPMSIDDTKYPTSPMTIAAEDDTSPIGITMDVSQLQPEVYCDPTDGKMRKQFRCPSCNKAMQSRWKMRRHLASHTGNKPYRCNECGKCFAESGLLTRHWRTHTGEKPFRCTVCCQVFTDSGNLRKHSRLHTGTVPHQCYMCGEGFHQLDDLYSHMGSHSGIRPFECCACRKTFTQPGHLSIHKIHCKAAQSKTTEPI